MKTFLFLLGMLFATSSCANLDNYPKQPPIVNKPTVTDTSVHVHWYKDIDGIAKVCPVKDYKVVYACSTWNQYWDMTVCDINSVMPSSFNDIFWLITLGHEFFHCLGANHG